MKNPNNKSEEQNTFESKNEGELPGYPSTPKSQDVYNKFKEESDIDPENTSQKKQGIESSEDDSPEEKDFFTSTLGSDLDVPGSELDDAAEDIGNEDEENNFYSLGDTD